MTDIIPFMPELHDLPEAVQALKDARQRAFVWAYTFNGGNGSKAAITAGYHRVNGLVNKIDDDIMSAIRVLCMDIRFAKVRENFIGYAARRSSASGEIAVGRDFDVFA